MVNASGSRPLFQTLSTYHDIKSAKVCHADELLFLILYFFLNVDAKLSNKRLHLIIIALNEALTDRRQ